MSRYDIKVKEVIRRELGKVGFKVIQNEDFLNDLAKSVAAKAGRSQSAEEVAMEFCEYTIRKITA